MQDNSWKVNFPPFLRDAMRAIGMDPDARGAQTELARAIDVRPSTLSRWLSGEMQPGIQPLRELATILRVRPMVLLIAAGHLQPADVPGAPATAEESIAEAPGLTDREKGELLGYLARMRERTGYYDTHSRPDEVSATERESPGEEDDDLRDETG